MLSSFNDEIGLNRLRQRRRGIKRLGEQEIANFPTDSCKFPTDEIRVLKISILSPNFPKWRIFSPHFVFLEENVPTG